jgi:hypothetical protein
VSKGPCATAELLGQGAGPDTVTSVHAWESRIKKSNFVHVSLREWGLWWLLKIPPLKIK